MIHEQARSLAALDLTLYEIANAIGVKQGNPKEADGVLQLVGCQLSGAHPRRSIASLIELGPRACREHGLTAYDAAYVAAARRHGWTLVSTDIRDLVSKGLAVTPDAADYP